MTRRLGLGTKVHRRPARRRRSHSGAAGAIAVATLLVTAGVVAAPPVSAQGDIRVRDLTMRQGEIPRRLLGYGLVVGLDGTGDRSFGTSTQSNPTVHSIVNLLRRFQIEIPVERIRIRNVAAVLVTAEISPYLRSGGRFEVQVSAIGDATSLRGGVLWITPLLTDPNQPAVATAQGPLYVEQDSRDGYRAGRANAGRIPQGGILEVDPPPMAGLQPRLLLRNPDLVMAQRIANALNIALGDSTANVEDPGSIALMFPTDGADTPSMFLAAVDTVLVRVSSPARLVISGREGTLVAGGDLRVGPAVIHHQGITLQIGSGASSDAQSTPSLVQVSADASVRDVAAGLQAAGAKPDELAAIFEALHAAGALPAEVVIR